MSSRPTTEDILHFPLVGREKELAFIKNALGRDHVGVVLVGQAGVGKSRLAQEALALSRRAGQRTYWLAATSDSAKIPFAVVSHFMSADPGAGGQLDVLRAVMRRVADADTDEPVVLGIDDIHHVDDASAALIHQLATHRMVEVVATMRAGERVSESIVTLWKDGLARLLDVEPLRPKAIDELVDVALGPSVHRTTREEIRRLAAGNPLLLRDMLIDGVQSGALAERHGMWCWDSGTRCGLRVTELVRTRLDGLSDRERMVLELAAQAEPLALAVLERLCDPDAITSAERSGLLVPARLGRRVAMRLQHPLYATVIRETMPVSRTRELRARLARAHGDLPLRRADDAERLAILRLDSGTDGDFKLQLHAARLAFAKGHLAPAERLARSAIGGGGGAPALRLLATILDWRGDSGAAASVLSVRSVGAELSKDDSERAWWALVRSANAFGRTHKVSEAVSLLDQAMAVDGAARHQMADVLLAWMMYLDGRCEDALDVAGMVAAAPGADPMATAWACAAAAAACGDLGRLSEAHGYTMKGFEKARVLENPSRWAAAVLAWTRCRSLLYGGRLSEARKVADDAFAEAVQLGVAEIAGMWAGAVGCLAKHQGQVMTARAALQEAVSLTDEANPFGLRRYHKALLAECVSLTRDGRDAQEWMARADADSRRPNKVLEIGLDLSRAWVIRADGEVTRAGRLARWAAAMAAKDGLPAVEAMALYDLARLGSRHDVVSRLNELTSRVEGDLVACLANAAAALASGDGDHLDRVTEELERCGLCLYAAETACAALRAHRSTGKVASAHRSHEHMSALMKGCEDARTPLLGPIDVLTILTQREREVAELAAAGRSSREIADLLTLSVRTVDNHLTRAYAKFGITGRAQLAKVMGPQQAGKFE